MVYFRFFLIKFFWFKCFLIFKIRDFNKDFKVKKFDKFNYLI